MTHPNCLVPFVTNDTDLLDHKSTGDIGLFRDMRIETARLGESRWHLDPGIRRLDDMDSRALV